MAVIRSGSTTDQLFVDTHQAAYVTLRDSAGNPVAALPVSGSVTVSNFPVAQAVSAATLPLPTGAATESGHLASIDTKLSGPVPVTQSGPVTVTQGAAGASAWKTDGSAVTQPISAVTLPLPAGAATDANLTAHLPLASNGSLQVTALDGFKATYVAGTSASALATSATDVLTVTGSATKTVRITKIYVSLTATTAISVPVSLIRRSSANTGGTSAALAATPRDTNNAAATAAVALYTANPTALGTQVGTVLETGKIPAPVTGGAVQVTVFEFGTGSNQAIVLRGTAQVLSLNVGGTTVAGGSIAVAVQWTEE